MKILQLVTKRQYRGAEVFAANLSEELIKLDHEIIFAGLYKNNTDILEVAGADNRDLIEEPNSKLSVKLVKKIIALVKETKPDVIQCNGSDTLKYAVAASFFILNVPILYRNISMISEWLSSTPKKVLYKAIFKKVAHISSVGNEAVEDIIQAVDFPREKTSVIRRGIPIKKVDKEKCSTKLKADLGLKPTNKIAIHIGNFSEEKNHEFLLDIFSEIKKEHGNIKLVCFGNGNLFSKIKQEITKRNLGDTIFLLGFRKDIPELLASSNCFVLSSKVEGVPGVILEAATQEIPSVATNVGGVSEVLINEKTGFLIENFNKEVFKEKLLKLMLDDALRSKMGKLAYKNVLEEFNPEKNALKFEELYRNLKAS